MKKKHKGRRGRVLNWKRIIITALIIFAIIGILIIVIPTAPHAPESGSIDYSVTQNAVIIRDETAYYAEFDFNRISICADEGKEVVAGEDLGTVYKLGYTEDVAQRLYEVQGRIYKLQKAQLSGINNPELEDAEDRVTKYREELTAAYRGEGTRSVKDIEHDLNSALSARNTLLRTLVQPTEELSSLYDEEATRRKQLDEWTSGRIVAQEAGIFSCYTDGRETSVCMAKIDMLSSAQVSKTVSGSGYSSALPTDGFMYRIVKPGRFCVAYVQKRDEAPRAYAGEKYTVSFSGLNMTYTGTCIRGEMSGDLYLTVIEFNDDIGELLTRRVAKITVSASFTGAKVNLGAISYSKEGEALVSFRTSEGMKKIAVKVLASDKNYAIIKAADNEPAIDGLYYLPRKD